MNLSPTAIAVIGASGQLGQDLVAALEAEGRYRVSGFGREALDVTDAAAVEREIGRGGYRAVINCAALTNVDECEEDGERALAVNATGAYLVARACRRFGAKNVLIGTDFVFGGDQIRPYVESDAPAPINIYGASKLSGELLARIAAPDSLLVRISSVFGKAGSRGKGGNFVETIIARARAGQPLKVIDDIVMSPTYTVDVADALPALLQANASGIVHLANSGSCSWFDFATLILELSGLPATVERVPSAAFPRPAARPANSALASESLTHLVGRPVRPWEDALKAYLDEKGHRPRHDHTPKADSEESQ